MIRTPVSKTLMYKKNHSNQQHKYKLYTEPIKSHNLINDVQRNKCGMGWQTWNGELCTLCLHVQIHFMQRGHFLMYAHAKPAFQTVKKVFVLVFVHGCFGVKVDVLVF